MEDYDARYSSDESRSPEPETKNPEPITDLIVSAIDNRFVVEVRGLSRTVNAEHLKEIFGVYGKILKAEHAFCPFRKMLIGIGLINYEDASGVEKAIDFLDQTQLDGKFIFVKKYDGRDLFEKARRNHNDKLKYEALDDRIAVTVQLPKQEDLRKRIENKKAAIETNVAFPGITRTVVQIDKNQEKNDTIRVKSPDRRLSVDPPPTEKKRISPPRNRRSPERKRSRSPERRRKSLEREEIKSMRKERSQSPVETKKNENNKKKASISRSPSRSPPPRRVSPDRRPIKRSPERRPIRRESPGRRVSPSRRSPPLRRSPDRRESFRRDDPGRRGGYHRPERRESPERRGPPFRRDSPPDYRRRSRSPERRPPIRREGSPRRRSPLSSSTSPPPKRRRSYSSSEDSPIRNKK
jgi:hypothetical protein